jgi:hypothetical protein
LKELSETHQVENSLARFRTPLTTERIRLLNDLGFTWTVRSKHANDENWTQKLDELKRYYEAHGHCNVPARCTENPALGIWVRNALPWSSQSVVLIEGSHNCRFRSERSELNTACL